MPWVRLDDMFSDHPKVLAVGPLAECLFVRGLTYASRYLTDGFVPINHLLRMADMDAVSEAAKLVSAGLWTEATNGYQIHDYLEYQPSKEQVLTERDMRATRKALYADPFLVQQVRKRDQDCCRYCSRPVRWTDRKSAGGGTYDHVIPDGGNSVDNLVVACRGCNSRKGKRTPEEAGMAVLPPIDVGTKSDLNPGSKESSQESTTRTPSPSRPKAGSNEPAPPTPQARDQSPSSSLPTSYEQILDGAMPKLVGLYSHIDKQFTEEWLRRMLREAEKAVGPLPRDKLGKGLDLAADQLRRGLVAGRVGNPRGLARKLIVDYLSEQRDDGRT